MPTVSVIIPTYNRRDFVREALASVFAQSVRDFEIIVVDDGSSDGTAEAVQEFAEVRCVWQPNRGVSAARNRGVALSNGKFVAFLDSDDLWQPHKLATQLSFFAAHPEAQICQTEELWLRNGIRVNPRNKHRKEGGDIFLRSLELCLVSPSAVMLRRELFDRMGGFDERLPACEDYDLWLRIAARFPVDLITTPQVIRRGGHADQLSRQFWGMDRFRVTALCKLLDSGVLSAEQYKATVRVLQKKCHILAHGAQKRGYSGEHYLTLAEAYKNSELADTAHLTTTGKEAKWVNGEKEDKIGYRLKTAGRMGKRKTTEIEPLLFFLFAVLPLTLFPFFCSSFTFYPFRLCPFLLSL